MLRRVPLPRCRGIWAAAPQRRFAVTPAAPVAVARHPSGMLRLRCAASPGHAATAARRLVSTAGGSSASAAASASRATSTSAPAGPLRRLAQRIFGAPAGSKIRVDECTFDKEFAHYSGKLFGVSAETLLYYLKINGGVAVALGMVYLFFKGYSHLTSYSLATVAKMGFTGGFVTCAVLYTTAIVVRRRLKISPNAVYNQAISIALRNEAVLRFVGPTPRTGEFRAYHNSGGFKLPLLRRLRSGQYELADLLGTKPRRLQMMFVLRCANGKEGLVSCDVRQHGGGLFGIGQSGFYFHSLAVHMSRPTEGSDDNVTIILIGGEADVVYKGILSL